MKHNTQTRRISLGILALASMVLFAGASIWEGAAAVSSGGDLPDSGFYIATNSFPRNTVVDITNLENGKSIKAIVSAGIDSPGLLAIVSREGALAIGLEARSIGRVRMSQPSDPIAYARLSEESLRSGDPDYDPEAALRAYGDRADSESDPETAVVQAAPGKKRTGDAPSAGESAPPASETFDETVIAVDSGPRDIETPDAGYSEYPETEIIETITETPAVAEAAEAAPVPDPAESAIAAGTAGRGKRRTGGAVYPAAPAEESPPDMSEAPAESAWFIPDSPPPESQEFQAEAETEADSSSETYTLVPAPERPPVPQDQTMPDSRYFIDPIESGKKTPETANIPPAPELLSIPVVKELEDGKYYLQIGAYEKTEAVESEVKKLGKVYPMLVQNTYVKGKLVHRVLVGPVNHGESGALLQRFRNGGYKTAYIRTSKTP
jgi:hypothetical protein